MTALRLVTVVGARPQFIKAAAVSRAIRTHNASAAGGGTVEEILVHTGQHYDFEMSTVFFGELELGEPAHHLGVGSGPHGRQTGEMLIRLEPVLIEVRPDVVIVHGDTNSTLAGALAAAKLSIPIAHVEAGLRSRRLDMPEEINRLVTDRLASLLLCPSETAVNNLASEGIVDGVRLVGDVMLDMLLWRLEEAMRHEGLLSEFGIEAGKYALCTVHRVGNTDDPARLAAILDAMTRVASGGLRVLMPLHPRTREALGHAIPHGVTLARPVSYEEMLCLEAHARVVVTDSGGIQKEAFWLGVPCVTLRAETEWVETLVGGWNTLVDSDVDRIIAAVAAVPAPRSRQTLYGNGDAANQVVGGIVEWAGASSLAGHLGAIEVSR